MLILEINDVAITLSDDADVLYQEPGVAHVDKGGVVFGHAALRQSRLHPRQSHNQFWQRLNADPVAPPGPGVANQADLVYLHLAAIRAAANLGERQDIVVAAPPTATTQQLGMLLGIATEAGFRVHAIVDASVAAASRIAHEGPVSVLDLTLHRAFLARLEVRPATTGTLQVHRSTQDEVQAAGYAALLEGWVDAVADRFVEGARFDPLRIAETEQQVFDQVLAGIENHDADYDIDIQHDGVSRHISVGSRAFAEKSKQRYGLLANAIGAPATLAITDRIRRLPGLAALLQKTHEVIALPANAVAAAIAHHAELVTTPAGGAGANFVTALPIGAVDPLQSERRPTPTHLLCDGTAIALRGEIQAAEHPACASGAPMFRIKRDGHGTTVAPDADATVVLNGVRIDFEHPAATGDRVVCGNAEFQLIAVADTAPER